MYIVFNIVLSVSEELFLRCIRGGYLVT